MSFVLCSSELQRDPTLLRVLEHPRLFGLFQALFPPLLSADEEEPIDATAVAASSSPSLPYASACSSSPAAPSTTGIASPLHVWTSCFKWLRGVPQGQNTGFHLDRVYMKADTPLLSLWLPLGDLSAVQGNLVVAPGSHRTPQFRRLRDEYGRTDVGAAGNGTTSGWIDVAHYTDEPVEVRTQANTLQLLPLWCNASGHIGLRSFTASVVFSFLSG
jgi:hypothetical protein